MIAGSTKIGGEDVADNRGDDGGGVNVRLVSGAKSGAVTGAETCSKIGAGMDSERGISAERGSGSGNISVAGVVEGGIMG